MPAPLAHLRVVDLTDLRGALAGRILADLGADVIRVERPCADGGRLCPPFAGGVAAPDRSLPFLYRNANKRGAVIDLHDTEGWRRFCQLCEAADVLVENLGPEEQRRHGLVPAEVRERHPHLVHVAMADFGLSGPHAAWHAEPIVAMAASGALYTSGLLDLPPCTAPGYLAHDCASIFAAAGALTAILDRARHGDGQTIEVSVQEAALAGLTPWSIPLADYARRYPVFNASPKRNGDGAYHVLPTTDGYVRVLCGSPKQWKEFVALLGEEALAGPEWEIAIYRIANGDVTRLLAGERVRGRSRAELLADARRRNVPMVPVNTPDEFVVEEQTRARTYFRRTGFPHLGEAPFAPAPFHLSATPAVLERPAPAPGEDDRSDFAPRAREAASGGAGGPALAGLRVISLGVGAVGPEVAGLLGELGAEVIKLESRKNLDFLRHLTLELDEPNRSWTFNVENRGQKSVCLDLMTSRGRELALRLCATADVVVENNRGGVVRAFGLDYDDVRRVRPDVVYVATNGFGRGGPLGEAPAYGPLNSTFAGVNWLWNHPDAPYPAGVALNHPDHIASRLVGVAVLAALEHRRRTGEGQLIEMAQTEAAAYLIGETYLEEPCTGRRPAPRGNASDHAVPHGVYPCAGEDRWVAIAVVGDEAWEAFRACLGWPADPALATLAGRLAARADLDARVAGWTRAHTPDAVASTLQAAGVSAMTVESADDLRADLHLAVRGALVGVEHAEIGPERHVGNPIRPSRTPLAPPAPAPLLGQHTEEVLTELLGLDRAEAAQLVEEGVCR